MALKRVARHYDSDKKLLETYSIDTNFDPLDVRSSMYTTKVLTANDRHSSHAIEGVLKVHGILYRMIDPDEKEMSEHNIIFKDESYEDYITKVQNLKDQNRRWIFNIIDRTAETESVIYRDDDFVLMPDYTWDRKTNDKIHILAIACDREIMSIRDLKIKHLDMLERIKTQSLKQIEKIYGIPMNKLKLFMHYPPSTYLLHIHITHISKCDDKTSFERCHDLDTVIKNIKLDENYYHTDMRITDICTN